LLDRTVASLEGKSDLVLVKRSMLPRYGIVDAGKSTRTTDPNGRSLSLSSKSPPPPLFLRRADATARFAASIFKRMSETPGSPNSVTDYTGAYKVPFE